MKPNKIAIALFYIIAATLILSLTIYYFKRSTIFALADDQRKKAAIQSLNLTVVAQIKRLREDLAAAKSPEMKAKFLQMLQQSQNELRDSGLADQFPKALEP